MDSSDALSRSRCRERRLKKLQFFFETRHTMDFINIQSRVNGDRYGDSMNIHGTITQMSSGDLRKTAELSQSAASHPGHLQTPCFHNTLTALLLTASADRGLLDRLLLLNFPLHSDAPFPAYVTYNLLSNCIIPHTSLLQRQNEQKTHYITPLLGL